MIEMAYKWCSLICENHESLDCHEGLLFVCLEIGFRQLSPERMFLSRKLDRTEPHPELVDIVFKSRRSEAIADLLCAFTIYDLSHRPAYALFHTCAGHLVSLHDLVPFSSRLRRLIICSIKLTGYKRFEEVGVRGFIELLNNLHVTVEDVGPAFLWAKLLLDTVQTHEGAQDLSLWYWELPVELTTLSSRVQDGPTYDRRITTLLAEAQEWSKLECWMGIVWMVWLPGDGGTAEDDFNRSTLSLFRQQPGTMDETMESKKW